MAGVQYRQARWPHEILALHRRRRAGIWIRRWLMLHARRWPLPLAASSSHRHGPLLSMYLSRQQNYTRKTQELSQQRFRCFEWAVGAAMERCIKRCVAGPCHGKAADVRPLSGWMWVLLARGQSCGPCHIGPFHVRHAEVRGLIAIIPQSGPNAHGPSASDFNSGLCR